MICIFPQQEINPAISRVSKECRATMKLPIRFYILMSLLVLLLGIPFGTRAFAQEGPSMDWILTQLRGTWQYKTFEDRWTVEFDCDHKMLLDRQPADYSLANDTIKVQGNDGLTPYPYSLDGDKLTLKLPDGSQRTYRRTNAGGSEHSLKGDYYSVGDSVSSVASISFDGDHSLVLRGYASDQSASMPGIYRVEGDAVVLTFGDTASYEAQIRTRDEDLSVKTPPGRLPRSCPQHFR